MATHPIVMRGQDEFLKTKEPLVSHMEVAPYNLKDIPLIWVWAHEGKAGYTKLFNTVEV
jgi:hypothetical protein